MRETTFGPIDLGITNAKATWAEELGGFAGQPEVIKKALEACANMKLPPTLPEFRQLCRQEATRPAPVRRIEDKPTAEQIERQRAVSQQIAEETRQKTARKPTYDYLGWARNPKSQYAMSAVWEEAQRGNSVMRGIADDLLARGICDDKGNLKK